MQEEGGGREIGYFTSKLKKLFDFQRTHAAPTLRNQLPLVCSSVIHPISTTQRDPIMRLEVKK